MAVINTQKGLFCYTRMPFIISSAPGDFQRTMDSLMQGIRDVVLGRLKKAGMRANKAKCSFMEKSLHI